KYYGGRAVLRAWGSRPGHSPVPAVGAGPGGQVLSACTALAGRQKRARQGGAEKAGSEVPVHSPFSPSGSLLLCPSVKESPTPQRQRGGLGVGDSRRAGDTKRKTARGEGKFTCLPNYSSQH